MKTFTTDGKRTIVITFNDNQIPDFVKVYKGGDLYYFRRVSGMYPSLNFNVCHVGRYVVDCDCKDISIHPIEISPIQIDLPPFERNRIKDFSIRWNPTLTGTPARNFSIDGVMEVSSKFRGYPFPIRLFILLHEMGHFYYATEKYADMFAAKYFLKMGYNESTAIFSLTQVLNPNGFRNKDRINSLYQLLSNE